MKAISLWQPWATAIAFGQKTVETRSWSTAYRGPLAIHAAKRFGPEQHHKLAESSLPSGNLPLGALVATAILVDVVPTTDLTILLISEMERFWGDYAEGRFAWVFKDVKSLNEPVPFKAKQGFFIVPDHLLADRLAA